MKKADIRRRFRALRDGLRDRAERSAQALEALGGALGTIDRLGSFSPIGSEADPRGAKARRIAYPRIEGNEIVMRWAALEELKPTGPYAIHEPAPAAPTAGHLDIVLVPGLVFDGVGGRLGYGRGFYDRLLRRVRGAGELTRFLGFGFQIQWTEETLPQHENDEPLDGFLSEAGLVWVEA
ncbi:MAG: 5-formyltetrahydrofolate cyclo-ligase [Myxococcota bacterium]